MILFQHSSPPGITQSTHASTTSIKIQIDQQDPIIHFCSGGSIVTKHKWPSSCLMSMIIIAAICRGFSKHLLWTQHQAEMDSSRRHCLPQTNHHYWHSLYSVFAPLSLAVCPFLIVLILAVPSTTLTPSSFLSPQPPPLSRSLDYSEPESGKVSLWKQGQRQWRALNGREGERDGDREKKTENWPVLRNPPAVISYKRQVTNESYSQVGGGNAQPSTSLIYKCLSLFLLHFSDHSHAVSFHWDGGKATSNVPDVMRYNHWIYKTWATAF